MKKNSIYVLVALMGFFTTSASAATVWQLASGDLSATYSNVGFVSGDIIELTANGATGNYTWTTKIGTLTKSFTIRAGSAVTTRPIVTLPAGITISTNGNTVPYSLTFDGIDFLGAGGGTPTSTGLTSAKGATNGDLTISMNNCIVRNLTAAARVFAYASSGTGWTTQAKWYGDLTVTNSEFTGNYAGVISFGSQYAGPNNTSFRNCYFSGLSGTIISNGLASLNTTNSLTLDHCTFNGSTGIEINIKNGGTSTTIVKNSLFANSPGSASSTDVVALSTNPGNVANTNNAVYYSGSQLISTRYPSGLLGSYITSNPGLTSNFATASPYIGTATDNRNIGYYNFLVLTPFISASTSSITGISYNLGAGPSTEKSFTVSAFDLTNNLVITPTSNLEISTSTGSGFSTNAINLSPVNHDKATTTIYVRLKAGLAINTYSQSISITHAGATTRTVSVPAQVISTDPNIQTTGLSLTSFTRFQNGGPSKPKSFGVIGVNLTGDIYVSAPTNFEISLTEIGGYTNGSLTLVHSGGAVSTTVYVRLAKALLSGSTTQNVLLTSSGATAVNVACSGSVTSITTANFNTNAANNVDLRIASNYSAAAMPIYSSQNHTTKVFVRNPDCWASDLDLTCISPSNFTYGNLHAGTLITPRHAILAAHFKLSTGDSLYFVTNDNVTVRRKIIGYKTNTIFSPIQFPDLEIVTLDDDVPTTISPCKFLPSNYSSYLSNNGRGLPTFSTDQEEKALVNEIESFNSLLVINTNPAVMMYSERTCTTTPRLALHEAIINGDSGNPVFLILRGELVLLSCRTWDNGAGSSYTHFANLATGGSTSPTDPTVNTLSINDLIAQTDAVAGVSTGYKVSYFDFTGLIVPSITKSVSSLSGFSYNIGSGPSAVQTFTVSAANINYNLTVTAPTNYQISSDGISYASSLTFSPTSGAVSNKTISVRLVAGLGAGSKTGDITLTSANVTTQKIALSGSVADITIENVNTGGNLSAIALTDPELASTNITVSSGELIIDDTKTVRSITVNSGAKLTIASGQTLTLTNLTLKSDATATSTYKPEGTGALVVTGTTAVEQYLANTRNYYVSSPVSNAVAPAGYTFYSRDETLSNLGWVAVNTGADLTAGKGYIALPSYEGLPITFTTQNGGSLNTGNVTVNLTYTPAATSGKGYNLIGNPYPSHLNWTKAFTDANVAKIEPTIWYRTKVGNVNNVGWSFKTYNAFTGDAVPLGTTGIIPPMQGFWVLAKQTTTIDFTDQMRSHETGNLLKVSAAQNTDRKKVRLQLSNGIRADETLLVFDANASDNYDCYDSPKMMNNATDIADIYTVIDAKDLVINGMNAVKFDTEIPVGFGTATAGDFSISASEFSNFEVDAQVVLLDKELTKEFDLSKGASYNFSSGITAANANRFSLLFRAPGTTTSIKNTEKLNAQVFVNAANQITIIAPEKCNYAISNAIGQIIENGTANSKLQTANCKLQTGIYVVKVGNETTRVIIK